MANPVALSNPVIKIDMFIEFLDDWMAILSESDPFFPPLLGTLKVSY